MSESSPMPPMGRGRVPTSPFEIEATKEAVHRRIEAGDISQADLDLLKKGYRWMTLSSFIGSVSLFVPTILVMRRRRPPVAFGVRLLAAGGMGMLGSFLGFTLGGVAAAMEVNRGMEDPKRKMQVFSEIAMEARQRALERSGISGPSGASGERRTDGGGVPSNYPNRSAGQSGIPRSFPRQGSTPAVGGDEVWGEDDGSRLERAQEMERERDYGRDVRAMEGDGRFASDDDLIRGSGSANRSSGPTSPSPMAQGSQAGKAGGGSGTGSTWDRLRQAAFPGQSAPSGGAADGLSTGAGGTVDGMRSGGMRDTGSGSRGMDAERSREQREFDEMLERERRGEDEGKTWK